MPNPSRTEKFQRIGVILLLLYTSMIGGTYYSDFFLIPAVIFQVVVTAVLVAWLIISIRQKRLWPTTPFDAVLAVHAVWLIVTVLLSRDIRVSLEGLWRFLVHIITFYMLVDFMRRGRQKWVMEALALTAGVIVLVSVLELLSWYIGLGFGGFTQGWITIDGAGIIPPYIHRLTLPLNNSTVLGNWVAMVLPVLFCWGLTAVGRDNRFGLKLLCVGLLFVEFFALSRGGWLATLAAGGVLTAFWLYRWSARSARYSPKVVMPLAGVGFLLALVGLLVVASVARGKSVIDQDEGRLDMWSSAADMTIDRPFTGFGVREFGAVSREYRDPSIDDNQLATAHNILLNISSETGIPGLLILLWLVGVYLNEWHREWATATPQQKLRLEGILAALVGLAVNSMVDAFILTTSTLPILIFAAYTIAGKHSRQNPAPQAEPTPTMRYLRPATLGVVVIYFGWLLVIDAANWQMMRSLISIQNDELDAALEKAESARSLDPALGLYDFHYAYVLGLLAEENPDEYLDKAIEAHEEALREYPTFDVAHANLAALYKQQDDLAKAVRHMRLAIENNSYKPEYYMALGQLLEEQFLVAGDNPMETEAALAYIEALELDVKVALSAFWDQGPQYTARVNAPNTFYQTADTRAEQVLVTTYRGWPQSSVFMVPEGNADEDVEAYARGVAFARQGDYQEAIAWYDQAIEMSDTFLEALVGRAEANYQLGNLDEAEADAQKALFIDPIIASRAKYILAMIRLQREDVPLDDELFNQQLIEGVQPRVQTEYFAQVVFLRPGGFDYLPQLQVPGRDADYYAPWFLLAERYAADDDPDTDPQDVHEAILAQDPYVNIERTRNRLRPFIGG